MRSWFKDFCTALAFLTRIKIPAAWLHSGRALADSAWAFPLVGLACGTFAGGVYLVSLEALPASLSAMLAVMTMLLLTGALHEDGVADCADGFYGGRDRESKLAIMKDSRIGTYGVLAVGMLLALRVVALAEIGHPYAVMSALVVSASISRALLPVMMRWLPLARTEGRAKEAGIPSRGQMIAGVLVAALITLLLWSQFFWLVLMAGAFSLWLVRTLACYHIGGYSGDVLGLLQQVSEVGVLLAFAMQAG